MEPEGGDVQGFGLFEDAEGYLCKRRVISSSKYGEVGLGSWAYFARSDDADGRLGGRGQVCDAAKGFEALELVLFLHNKTYVRLRPF